MSNNFTYLASADLTDVGRRRKNNEDAVLRLPELGIFCVADGMGGVQGGEVASKATVDALREAFTASPDAAYAVTAAASARLVERAVNRASQWIKARSDERGTPGTGSTVVTLVFDRVTPSRAAILHAGDSRAYRYRADKLAQMTKDHSVAAAAGLADDKTLPAMFRGVITRAVGLESTVQLEETATDVHPGDLFLLCSDGLDKMVNDKNLHKLLRKHRDDDAQALARVLLDEALRAGGEDNVSVVVVRVAAELPAGPTMETPAQTRLLEQPSEQPPAAGPAAAAAEERETGQTANTGQTLDSGRFEGEGVTPPELSAASPRTPQTPPTPPSGDGHTPGTPVPAARAIAEPVEEEAQTATVEAATPARGPSHLLVVLSLLGLACATAAWFFIFSK